MGAAAPPSALHACAQLLLASQVWRRWQLPNYSKRDQGYCRARELSLWSGLFSCDRTVRVRDRDAWMQQRCSVERNLMMRAQLPLDSQV